MYIPAATCILSAVYTPSHPNPMPKATIESTMRMLGRERPKSNSCYSISSREVALSTSIAPNDQKYHDLYRKADPIAY